MIISHSYKFIFARPKKVASTSIVRALLQHLKPEDCAIGPGLNDDDDLSGLNRYEGRKPETRWPFKLSPHSSLARAYRIYGDEILDYRVITATRNPWDRAVSQFYWDNKNAGFNNLPFESRKDRFSAYIDTMKAIGLFRSVFDKWEGRERTNYLCQASISWINGASRADKTIRFEHLDADLLAAGEFLGLPAPLILPAKKFKSNYRPKEKSHWRDYYTDKARDIVAQCCHREVQIYSYSFDD